MSSSIILNVKGKNINNFIHRLNRNGINIYKIIYIEKDNINIEVSYKDYDTIFKLKTIYDISIIDYKGIKKITKIISYNKYLIISIIMSIGLLIILSNIIFDVEVLYSGNEMRNYIYNELSNYGIKKYNFVKSFDDVDSIKNEILKNNKDKLEWLDIERVGTKYIVRLEPRKIIDISFNDKIYDIVASRDAIIKSIEAYSGVIVGNINQYVRKGDVIISNEIKLNDEIKKKVSSKGNVYGEVWYKISVSYPLKYYEEKETGNVGNYLNIRFINKDYNLSKFKKYNSEDKIIFKSMLLPIYLSYQKEKEIEIINYDLTEEECVSKAKEKARNIVISNLEENEYIIDEKSLKISKKDSKMIVDMFYTVYKNITMYKEIEG